MFRILLLTVCSHLTLSLCTGEIFTDEPVSQLIPTGSTAEIVFGCRAGSDLTNPVYTWKKDGVGIDIEGNSRINLFNGDLHISSPATSDAGSYQCFINGDQGKVASNFADLQFEYLNNYNAITTYQIQQPGNTGVTMICGDIVYYPEYTVFFFWEEVDRFEVIGPAGNRTHYISQKTGNLYIANSQTLNSGNYKCGARSIWQSNNGYARTYAAKTSLTIQDANFVSAPTFLIKPDEITYAKLNGKTGLECFAAGNPTPMITWTKNGASRLPAGHVITGAGQLFFEVVTKEVEGMYTCTANNTEGRIVANGEISFQYPPVWKQEINSIAADLASTISFVCEADSVPSPVYTWLKDTKKLSDETDPDITITHSGSVTKLSITGLSKEDAGMYQCAASNMYGNLISSAQLSVNSYPPVIDPPVPSLTYAALGGITKIPCLHTAAPAANISWYKNDLDRLSQTESQYDISSDGTLTIYNVAKTDEAKYTCILENILGDDQSSGNLQTYDATAITTYPTNVTSLLVGSSAELFCDATYDQSLTITWGWNHDGEDLDTLWTSKTYFIEGGQLTIREATASESGKYTCCAKTKVGTPCASAYVLVTAPPDPPINVKVEGATSTTHQLAWTAPNDNNSPILAYIVQKKNSYDEDWTLAVTEPLYINTTSTKVIHLLPYNDYEYRVFALNKLGKSRPSETSIIAQTLNGAPARAPSKVRGGGGEIGQLVVTWKPLEVQYYGSNSISYVIAIQKRVEIGVTLPLPPPNANGTVVVEKPDVTEEPWTETAVLDETTSNYTFTVADTDVYQPYNVKIRADNKYGEGPFSMIKVVHTFEIVPEKTPTEFKLQSPAKAYSAVLRWAIMFSKNGRIKGYKIKITRQTGGVQSEKIFDTESPVTLKRIEDLAFNTVYEASILGYNRAGDGPWSAPFVFNTAKKPPQQSPQNVKVTIEGTILTTSWSPITAMDLDEADLSGYKVQYWFSNRTSATAMTHKTTANALQFGVPNGALLNVWVRGYSSGGDGIPSTVFSVSTESASTGAQGCCGANTISVNLYLILSITMCWLLLAKKNLQ